MKNFNFFFFWGAGVHWKIGFLWGGRFLKNHSIGVYCLKGGGGLGQFPNLRGELGKKEGSGAFDGG